MAGGSYIGLDIGSNLMKVAEVRRGSKGIEVVSLDVAPTPQEAFENSVITDPQMLGQAVKALLKKAGISGGQVISSVSGQSAVVVRVIDVPQMNTAELAETMKWEVERQVPFNASEVVMDYQPIQRPEGYADGANMEVCLAVAQQDMIDRHVEMLFAAKLKPKAIDVEPLASARCLLELNSANNTPGYTVAIINVGAANTDVSIFRDKLIAFPRTLSLAGDNLTRAISNDMHVDLATAEQMKRDVGEVIMGQAPPQDNFGGGFGGGFGAGEFGAPSGFMDFTDPAAPVAAPYVDPAAPARQRNRPDLIAFGTDALRLFHTGSRTRAARCHSIRLQQRSGGSDRNTRTWRIGRRAEHARRHRLLHAWYARFRSRGRCGVRHTRHFQPADYGTSGRS